MTLYLWCYLICAVLLIVHEIDSAYWKEWELFGIKFDKDEPGLTIFLLLHIPIVLLILMGVIAVYIMSIVGIVLSLVIGVGGLFAFVFHGISLLMKKKEFKTVISIVIIIALGLSSILLILQSIGFIITFDSFSSGAING